MHCRSSHLLLIDDRVLRSCYFVHDYRLAKVLLFHRGIIIALHFTAIAALGCFCGS